LLLRAPHAVRRGHREPPAPGGFNAPGDPSPEAGRAFWGEQWVGRGPRRTPDAPGVGEHDRLDSRGRLQGYERVPAPGCNRGPQP
jgi:hypothetical protein